MTVDGTVPDGLVSPPPTEFDIPLAGFPGTSLRLAKYAAVHAAAGCHTACTIAPPGVVFALMPAAQRAFAVAVATAVAGADAGAVALRGGRPPLTVGGVVLHPFSNGGAFVVQRLVELAAMAPAERRATLCSVTAGDADAVDAADAAVSTLWAAIAGTLYDSCPVMLSHSSAVTAFTTAAGVAVGSPGGSGLVAAATRSAVVAGLAVWLATQYILVGDVPAAFWSVMRDGEAPGGAAAGVAYAYSAADVMADTPALEALIASRRSRGEGDVRAWRVEDAPHVALLRTHREAYGAFAGECVTHWVAAWRSRQQAGGGGALAGVDAGGGGCPPEGAM
ncbi:hypothetical protein MMPV_007248 [Pyropia vietnamensis]